MTHTQPINPAAQKRVLDIASNAVRFVLRSNNPDEVIAAANLQKELKSRIGALKRRRAPKRKSAARA